MLKRLLTGIVIMLIFAGSFALRFVSPYFFDAFILLATLFCSYEVCSAFEKGGKKNDKYINLSYPVLIYAGFLIAKFTNLEVFTYFAIIIAIMVALFAVTLVINVSRKKKINIEMVETNFNGNFKTYVLKKSLLNLFLMVYPTFLMSLIFVINNLTAFKNINNTSGASLEFMLLIILFVSTIVTDTCAYLVGSGIRGKKLCPNISPNKTISGAVGGFICAIAVCLAMYMIFYQIGAYSVLFANYNIIIWHFLGYGVFASIISQFGDIFASFIKRRNNIKDYGKIFPGHGGVMDRFDGVMFNAIITFIFGLIVIL